MLQKLEKESPERHRIETLRVWVKAVELFTMNFHEGWSDRNKDRQREMYRLFFFKLKFNSKSFHG